MGGLFKKKLCNNAQWYRLAIGLGSPNSNSAIINFTNDFNNMNQRSTLLYVCASSHGVNHVERLDNGDMLIDNVRIIYKRENLTKIYLDVRFLFGNEKSNNICVAYSCNINFQFQPLTEVSDIVEDGYKVDEFTFV